MIRRILPGVAALAVIAIGLVGASCVASTTGGQTTTPTSATATPTFGITFNGRIFKCSQGACPKDITWDGSTTITSTAHAAVLNTGQVSEDQNVTDTISFSAIRGVFEQNPGNVGKITITRFSIFYVHTNGLASATTPPALSDSGGYFSAVQVYSISRDASGAPTLLLYFVTFSANGQQKAGGAAAIHVPQQGAHITVNLTQTGGGLSVLDGSTGASGATPTATTKP